LGRLLSSLFYFSLIFIGDFWEARVVEESLLNMVEFIKGFMKDVVRQNFARKIEKDGSK